MAIQKLKLLDVSAVSDRAFRSLQDVETYLTDTVKKRLDELEGLVRQYQLQFSRLATTAAGSLEFEIDRKGTPSSGKPRPKFAVDNIDKIVVPKLDSLKKNFGVVKDLAEQVDSLTALYNNVSVNFRTVRGMGETLNSIKALKKAAETKLEKALTFLKNVGDKHAPEFFKEFVQKTMAILEEGLEFKNYSQSLYAHENDEGGLQFTYYVNLRGLLDEEGNIYPSFYLVFTCVLTASEVKGKLTPLLYVNTMHDFLAPGAIQLGTSVRTANDAANTLSSMLDLENVNHAIGILPHNVDPGKVTPSKFSGGSYITKIEVDAHSFTFTLLEGLSGDQVKDVVVNLYKEVKGMLTHIKNAQVKVKLTDAANKKAGAVAKFTLTNIAPDAKISGNDLDFLRTHYGLDDTKLRRITHIINHE